ncbi:GNAT family N-acetyltransferase [Novipirellula artificiosorum]|uniref:N-acetyltransferase domain-containing protein n=1 Tax=Novipirellula artificiosorum TaxID=2528016 RepID=A0A5C6DS11_9BACT|nr:GNAT family N-acetyltransferase [Novipirellula artificiosorum]TWU39462.1 hypothetical protein Poly41_22860 [Novipirellula artificiosorum]
MNTLLQMCYLPYRAMRRIATANICHFLAVELDKLEVTPLSEGLTFEEVTPSRLPSIIQENPELLDDNLIDLIQKSIAHCYVVLENKQVVAFSWLATGNVPAEFNHDENPNTQLPFKLPSHTAYIFNAYVSPPYRGKRLYGAMMSGISSRMSGSRILRLVMTTEASNHRALRSVRRMGFRTIGRSMLFGVGKFCVAYYPRHLSAWGIYLGRYEGDRPKLIAA